MKSSKKVLKLEDVVKPFRITFPVTIEGGINNEGFYFQKNVEVTLSFAQYEALTNSDYAKYLG